MIDLYIEGLIIALLIGVTLTAAGLWVFWRLLENVWKCSLVALFAALLASGGTYPYQMDFHGMPISEHKFWVMAAIVLVANLAVCGLARYWCAQPRVVD
jgi:hypothetical protein